MKKYFLLSAALSVILLTFSACDSKRPAAGEEDVIHLVSDSSDFAFMDDAVNEVFGMTIYTPQPENLFRLKRYNFENFYKIRDKKNVLIVAPLNSGSKSSDYVKSILDSAVVDMITEKGEFFFLKYDLWAKNQLVMIVTGNSYEEINRNLLSNKEKLVYYFKKLSDQRLSRTIYKPAYEKKEVEGNLLRDYGWTIFVQLDYNLGKSDSDENFVWLRRAPGSDMERWIFVHWIENSTPEMLNTDSVTAVRNRLTKKLMRTSNDSAHVEIADISSTKEVNFNGRYSIMTYGFWRMNDKSMGGPFINYVFFDEKTNRTYFVDGSIYAPKYYKKKLIQQVDVLLQSFRTEAELSPDRVEELLSEATEAE